MKQPDWRTITAALFLTTQLILIVWARFSPEKYFCWAPHDCQTEYELTVFINGREINDKEIAQRFHHPRKYRDVRAPGNVKGWIKQYAQTYGQNDEIMVVMDYKVNGIPQEPWRWHSLPKNK